jgi:acyl carrier protein
MNDPQIEFMSVVKELLALKDADFASKSDSETMELGIQDLNLDSLEKMELIMKVEDTFKVMLDEGEVLKCEKIQHLYGLVRGAMRS